MNKTEYNKLSDFEKKIFSDLYKPNKKQTYNLKFTHRQLELIMYACELAIDGRKTKDQNTLSSIQNKIDKLNIDNFSTLGIDNWD